MAPSGCRLGDRQACAFAGEVLVASELRGSFYIVEPGDPYRTIRLGTNLKGSHYDLDGAAVIP